LGFITIDSGFVRAASVIYVGSGPGNDSANISGGIILANDGDTVFVYAGTYSESVLVNKSITLTGESKENTVINGTAAGHVIQVSAHWVNISGFEITGGGVFRAGIYVNGYFHCTFEENNIIGTDYGIFIVSSSNNTITQNQISDIDEEGIYIENSPHNNINFNDISNSSFNGINLFEVSKNTVSQNNISGCEKDGINFYNLSNSVISENSIWNNQWNGILGSLSSENTFSNNNISNNLKWGIVLSQGTGNTVSDNTISGNSDGIRVHDESRDNHILENNITGGSLGIFVDSQDNLISENYCQNGWLGVRVSEANMITITQNTVSGIELSDSSNITVSDNIISSDIKKIYIYFSSFSTINNNSAKLIHLVAAENNSFTDNTVTSFNIERRSHFNTIIQNQISEGEYGFEIHRSTNNNITNNTISNCTYAVHLSTSANENSISSNTLSHSEYGIYLKDSNDNEIINNIVANNDWGFYLKDSQDNVMANNSVLSNSKYGFYLLSGDNRIFHNSIVKNFNQSYDESVGGNLWDNGYPSGGNYWSDYLGYDNLSGEFQDILGADGIGDTPYIIDNNSQDNYPIYVSPGPILPQAPQNLQLTPGEGEIILTWQAPFSDGGDAIKNYKVYRGSAEDQEELLIELGNILTYTDSDVSNDVTYFYKVSAVNGISEGPLTSSVNATTESKSSKEDEDGGGFVMIILVIVVVVIVLLLLLFFMRKREGHGETQKERFRSLKKESTVSDYESIDEPDDFEEEEGE
jgi:parallel beta-helix repeat protein